MKRPPINKPCSSSSSSSSTRSLLLAYQAVQERRLVKLLHQDLIYHHHNCIPMQGLHYHEIDDRRANNDASIGYDIGDANPGRETYILNDANSYYHVSMPSGDDMRADPYTGSALGPGAATRWTPTQAQLEELHAWFYVGGVRTPTASQISRITARLRAFGRIEGRNVFYWFQNQKARERKRAAARQKQEQAEKGGPGGGQAQSGAQPQPQGQGQGRGRGQGQGQGQGQGPHELVQHSNSQQHCCRVPTDESLAFIPNSHSYMMASTSSTTTTTRATTFSSSSDSLNTEGIFCTTTNHHSTDCKADITNINVTTPFMEAIDGNDDDDDDDEKLEVPLMDLFPLSSDHHHHHHHHHHHQAARQLHEYRFISTNYENHNHMDHHDEHPAVGRTQNNNYPSNYIDQNEDQYTHDYIHQYPYNHIDPISLSSSSISSSTNSASSTSSCNHYMLHGPVSLSLMNYPAPPSNNHDLVQLDLNLALNHPH